MASQDLVLTIGSRNTSSWSLRPWLVLRRCGVVFSEEVIRLRQPKTKRVLSERSPSGLVPFLRHGDTIIWDSLAVCEYLAELFPDLNFWPRDTNARAHARSVSAEMHAGFAAMRRDMPMDFLATVDGYDPSDEVAHDLDRVFQIWADCRAHHEGDGPFLFGAWSIADAMFAPVVSRVTTYRIALPVVAAAYAETVRAEPDWGVWADLCRAERDQR